MINIESLSRNKNLNAQKNWLKKTNPVRTTDWSRVVVNYYACNRPASWPLNVRQATKIKFTWSEFKTVHSIIYPLERKKRKSPRDENA